MNKLNSQSLQFSHGGLSRLVCLVALTGVAVGCGQPNVYQGQPTPEVLMTTPVQQAVTSYVEQTGTTQATERVELRSRVAGYLVERNFEDGGLVKKGQLLFVIDEAPFKVKLDYANARLDEANSNLRKAKESKAREIAQAQLTLDEAEYRLAQVNHDRNLRLLQQNAGSQQEIDNSEAALKKAAAQVIVSQSELEQAQVNYQTDILNAQAAVALAKSEVESAQIDLGYCRIVAPMDGMIDRRTFDVGNYVSNGNSEVLATIVQVKPIYAYTAISEPDLVRIKQFYQGREDEIVALMGIGDDRTFPFQGKIDYISPSVQADTGTVQIRAVFENSGLLMPGMFVRIRVPAEEIPDALLVTERAIGYDQAGSYVYVINDENVIERCAVELGDVIDAQRVVKGNLTADTRIVADGLLKVRPSVEVVPKPINGEASPAGKTPAQESTAPTGEVADAS